MASRDYLKHVVSTSEPVGSTLGDQWYNPITNALSYRLAVNGTSVSWVQITGSPEVSAQGSDANISLVLRSKGAGAIDLVAGSSGVNISNGSTVTAVVAATTGSGYSSIPTIAISAPTTVGGVQATASANLSIGFGWTIVNAGTGYNIGDVLTIVGGTGTVATYGVSTIGALGAVTSIARFGIGSYSALPPSPSSTTTNGSGTGFTIANLYGFASGTITNAGSGYIEQPTVTVSGGGGTGAAAYATIGSGTAIKSLGSTLSFNTPGGTQLFVNDSNGTVTDYIYVSGSNFGRPAIGARTFVNPNASLLLFSTGTTGNIQFGTNNGSQMQARITHTDSAVNYLNFTGAATNNAPVLSAQGSDTDIGLAITSKGFGVVSVNTGTGTVAQFQDRGTSTITSPFIFKAGTTGVYSGVFTLPVSTNIQVPDASIIFRTQSGASGALGGSVQFTINNPSAAVNWLQVAGSATTVAPELSSQGSDTNISLKLTPKGTGVVQVTGTIRSTSATVASSATITPTSDLTNQYTITALATDATVAIPSGTPIDGQRLTIRIKDNGTGRALTWTTSAGGYRVIGTTLPTGTVATKTIYVGCIYNSADSFWDVIASSMQL